MEFEVLLGVDADSADDSALDVLESAETDLLTYCFISLTELNEECPEQMQPVLYVVV